MNLDALRSLQKQASPETEKHDPRSMEQRRRDDARQAVNHRFGELGKAHLLPLAEALEACMCIHEEAEVSTHNGECFDDGVKCTGRPCRRCKALKNLQEALE